MLETVQIAYCPHCRKLMQEKKDLLEKYGEQLSLNNTILMHYQYLESRKEAKVLKVEWRGSK